MDRIDDPLLTRFAAEYLPRLRQLYAPSLVLAFGSRARGDALADSDVDLLVVSDKFRHMSFLNRAFSVLTSLDLPFAVDLLCYTPEEFENKRAECGIVSAAVEEGIVLESVRRRDGG